MRLLTLWTAALAFAASVAQAVELPPDVLAAFAKACPRIAFIRRANYGMNGTNATMFGRRTGRGAAICVYDLGRRELPPREIFRTDEGFIFDMSPGYDGEWLVFSYKVKTDEPFHIWEIKRDGTGLRQITDGRWHDVSPVYYPDGRIVFTSSRVESFSLCQDYLACALHICDLDGSNLRRFDFTTLCTISPFVLDDGTILCTRWEYQDKNIFSWEGLWTINPDGRQLKLFHGNTLTVPNAVYGAKQIPGTRKVILTMAAHHHPPIGDIAIVDRSLGVENPAGMTKVTHATSYKVTAGRDWRHTNWQPGDRIYRHSYTDPYPVTRDHSLVSDGTDNGRFCIALLSHGGGTVPVYVDKERQCFNPVPLAPRPLPRVVPGECVQEAGYGTFYVQDVYQGLLRQGVERGMVKALRVMSQVPKKYNTEGGRYHDHYPIIGHGSYYVKVNHGTVPVDESGAAFFRAPANTELFFEALDENGKEIIRMGSVTQITAGEQASCIGCHEPRFSAPATDGRGAARLKRRPDEIKPPAWGAGPVNYVSQVQPVLDRYCVKCHSGIEPRKGIDLTGDKTRFYSKSYESLVFRNYVVYYYINPGPTGNFPALSSGSWVSRLTKMIEGKHSKVDMDDESRRRIYAWIDANVPYYDTWDMTRPHSQGGRDLTAVPDAQRGFVKAPWQQELDAVCGKVKLKSTRLVDELNFTNPQRTPAILKLLARSAGGTGPDDRARFKSKDDPVYIELAAVLDKIKAGVERHPRIDMPGAVPVPQQRDFGRTY